MKQLRLWELKPAPATPTKAVKWELLNLVAFRPFTQQDSERAASQLPDNERVDDNNVLIPTK